MTITTAVRDARPPIAVIRVLNPIMRTVLRTPLGRLVRPFALLEFTGRRTGRHYRVPAGWHEAEGVPVVFTPAPWRANFVDGARVTVHHRGRTFEMTGTLVADPTDVARALHWMFANGTPPRAVGLDMPADHDITAADVVSVDRTMIVFAPS
jgi:hypothetical protein